MPVNIHGKSYNTVAERILSAGKDLLSVETEILFQEPVVIKATIQTPKGFFSGISAANPSKSMEKESPYEVAETSAVGRALAFAGYETTNGIASAEEVNRTLSSTSNTPETASPTNYGLCPKCGALNIKYSTGRIGCSKYCWKHPELQTLSTPQIDEDIPF